jgi:hypothetical protein
MCDSLINTLSVFGDLKNSWLGEAYTVYWTEKAGSHIAWFWLER